MKPLHCMYQWVIGHWSTHLALALAVPSPCPCNIIDSPLPSPLLMVYHSDIIRSEPFLMAIEISLRTSVLVCQSYVGRTLVVCWSYVGRMLVGTFDGQLTLLALSMLCLSLLDIVILSILTSGSSWLLNVRIIMYISASNQRISESLPFLVFLE